MNPFFNDAPKPLAHRGLEQKFTDFVLDRNYPCLGAKSAFRTGAYCTGLYPALGTPAATESLATDLLTFIGERSQMKSCFATFVAFFLPRSTMSEEQFEEQLWKQLSDLHDTDTHDWDSSVSNDVNHDQFGFSFGGLAFFVIGLHPRSARYARRFERPALVFNAHDQFEHLKRQGKFTKMRAVIRARDQAWQGTTNPMMADFGSSSEARQYSGRVVSSEWQCPFRPKSA